MNKYITVATLLVAGTTFANAETTYWWQKDVSDMADVDSWKTDGGASVPALDNEDSVCSIGGNGGNALISEEVHFNSLRISAWANLEYTYTSVDGMISANSIIRDANCDKGIKIYVDYTVSTALNTTVGELVLFSSEQAFSGMDDLTRVWTEGGNDFISVYVKNENGAWNTDAVISGDTNSRGIFSSVSEARNAISQSDRPYALVLTDHKLSLVSAIPEPSAFGLLAGIGALALVASRRRRK